VQKSLVAGAPPGGTGKREGREKARVMEGRGGKVRERMERRGRKGGDLLHKFRGAARRPLFNSSKQTLHFGITQTTLGGLLYILLQISCIGRQRKSVKKYEHIG